MSLQVLGDDDVRALMDYRGAVRVMEDALRELAAGALVAPPRFSVETSRGSLVFTAGALDRPDGAMGFRVYDTAGASTDTDQLVAVFRASGGLEGVVVGGLVGAMRTGALGGVAIDHLARADAKVLAVVGAGHQARTQIEAALAVRGFERVTLVSRSDGPARRLRDEVAQAHGVGCTVEASVRDAVSDADVVVCATSSTEPVLESGWIRPGTHVSTVGPKLRGAQELPSDIGKRCRLIATDSPAQVAAYGSFFLDAGPAPVGLEEVVTSPGTARSEPDAITLYCSVGLAGTEVLLAREILRRARRSGPARDATEP